MSPRAQRNRKLLLQRTALLVFCYTLPLGGLALFLIMTGVNRQIKLTGRERLGVHYIKQLARVHDAAANEILQTGRVALSPVEMESELAALEQSEMDLGPTHTPLPANPTGRLAQELVTGPLRAAWADAQLAPPHSKERTAALMMLMDEGRALIAQLGDTTGLTLSPNLETEYMTDVVAASIPTHLERLLQAHELVIRPGRRDQASGIAARLYATMLNGEAEHLERATEISIRGNAASVRASVRFQGNYPVAAAAFLAELKRFTAAVASNDSRSDAALNWEEVFRSEYINAAKFWHFSIDQLDLLLTDQIEHDKVERTTAIAIAAAILLTLLPFTWLYIRGYVRPVVQDLVDEVREAADAAARAKNQFLAMMSHEIRTPMNGVIGFANLLDETSLDDQQRDFVRTIRVSGEALLAVINDILDFSKLEAGKAELELHTVVIRDVVEEVLELLSVSAAAKKLELIYWIDPNVPEAILGDATRLRQILINLAGNAIKFTPAGHVEIAVSAAGIPNSLRVIFHIRDTGIGISPAGLARLFKPFSQADSSVTRTHGGTGLGLAICQRLVDLMAGEVGVSSELGKGADFHFSLPVHVPADADHPPLSAAPPSAQIGASLRGRRILIVDDYSVNRRLFERILQPHGAEVTSVGPDEAEKVALSGGPFDLMVLDYVMPVMDGQSLAETIKTRLAARCPPLILVSSVTLPPSSLPDGLFAAVITKPIRNLKFIATIASVLTGGSAPGRPGAKAGVPRETPPKFALSHPLRVLAVDDNPVNLRVISMGLTAMGYAPVVTEQASAALDRLRTEKFDLVLMDVQMPDIDGLEATRRLRGGAAGALNQQVRVLALTAGTTAEERQSCREAGMSDFIAKPFARAVLIEKLAAAFEAVHAGDGLKVNLPADPSPQA